MSPWLTFVIGVILGLLAGWLLDVFARRRPDAQRDLEPAVASSAHRTEVPPAAPVDIAAPAPLSAAEAAGVVVAAEAQELSEPAMAEAELPTPPVEPEQQPGWVEVSQRVAEVPEAAEEGVTEASAPAHVSDELPPADAALPAAAVAALAASEAGEPAASAGARDKLIVIEGIGPVYEAKLNAAGINTFRQMIAAGPERLREIIQPQGWQRVDFAEWIEQARLIDEGKDEELRALQARLFSRKKP